MFSGPKFTHQHLQRRNFCDIVLGRLVGVVVFVPLPRHAKEFPAAGEKFCLVYPGRDLFGRFRREIDAGILERAGDVGYFVRGRAQDPFRAVRFVLAGRYPSVRHGLFVAAGHYSGRNFGLHPVPARVVRSGRDVLYFAWVLFLLNMDDLFGLAVFARFGLCHRAVRENLPGEGL